MLLSGVEWQSYFFFYLEFFHVFPRMLIWFPPKNRQFSRSPIAQPKSRAPAMVPWSKRRTWTNASPACGSWPCLWRAMWRFCNPSSRRTPGPPGMGTGMGWGKQSVKPLVVFWVPPKISYIWYIYIYDIYDICDIWNASKFDPFFLVSLWIFLIIFHDMTTVWTLYLCYTLLLYPPSLHSIPMISH